MGGWFLFAFLGALILRAVWALMLLGGSCASGGPYVIAVPCPPAVTIIIPWAIFAMLAVVFAASATQRGFGTPLHAWAWPLGFGGLGLTMLAAVVATGRLWFAISGVMFLLFAAPVVVSEWKTSPLRWLGGETDVHGQPIRPEPGQAVIAVALTLAAAGAGAWLGWTLFDALPG